MIYLRSLGEKDYPLTLAWRSNPLVYQGFYQQEEPLKWGEHISWLESRNKDWRNFIVMYEDRPVGVVTIGQLDHWEPELGWYIGEVSLWGCGVGKEAVRLGLDYLRERGYKSCHTTIPKNNTRCLALVKSLGFEITGEAREDEVWIRLKL